MTLQDVSDHCHRKRSAVNLSFKFRRVPNFVHRGCGKLWEEVLSRIATSRRGTMSLIPGAHRGIEGDILHPIVKWFSRHLRESRNLSVPPRLILFIDHRRHRNSRKIPLKNFSAFFCAFCSKHNFRLGRVLWQAEVAGAYGLGSPRC